jgi:hypothetical protein
LYQTTFISLKPERSNVLKLLIKMTMSENLLQEKVAKNFATFWVTINYTKSLGPLKSSPNGKFSPNQVTLVVVT